MAKKDKKDKKDKKEKKEKGKKEKEKKKSKASGGKMSMKARVFMIAFVLLSLAFLPTAMLLGAGMLPSVIAFFIGDRRRGARASTISAMNAAGCIPFVLKLWSGENTFEASMNIVTDTQSMMVIYVAAAFGYMIDWVVTGLVSSYLYQKGLGRMSAIKRKQEFLVSHWGEGITGNSKSSDND
ncbi:MAG: hypothetical protein COA45_01955 [Zetaproteobacteria bacterium]|nr:MAG: hypothetical protein COA45_01955 [Zetaproteobacteria bacterium]